MTSHMISYVKIMPYLISLLFWQRWRGFKLSDEIRFQNAGKRQIMIISDFYVVNTSPLYKIIAGNPLAHIIKLYPVWFAD